MEKYLIVAPATFGAGARLGLSKEQAAARAQALRESGKGVYVAVQPVQFKAGETISVDGELPKVLAALVEAPKGRKAKSAAEPAPEESGPEAPGESPQE